METVQARPPAKSFEDLVVWQKAHQFVLQVYVMTEESHYYLILTRDLKYADPGKEFLLLEEVSRLLEAYRAAILRSK